MIPLKERVTYYALLLWGHTRENPSGLARRRFLPEGGIVDEAFQRDLQWHDSDVIWEWRHGESSEELVEISEAEAERIMERFREKSGE
ncbi:hypothetical protein OHA25_15380 [Nonomuraea sp. NBC_00507]|uniref:hypothetical protein n=1 Tax=Nonomuraea sp. NBC_00507 TaxID=2976002 RepID=UPI002E19F1E1